MAASEAQTITFALSAPIARSDLQQLCECVCGLVERTGDRYSTLVAEVVAERVEHAVADRCQLGGDVVRNVQSLFHLLHGLSVGPPSSASGRRSS